MPSSSCKHQLTTVATEQVILWTVSDKTWMWAEPGGTHIYILKYHRPHRIHTPRPNRQRNLSYPREFLSIHLPENQANPHRNPAAKQLLVLPFMELPHLYHSLNICLVNRWFQSIKVSQHLVARSRSRGAYWSTYNNNKNLSSSLRKSRCPSPPSLSHFRQWC